MAALFLLFFWGYTTRDILADGDFESGYCPLGWREYRKEESCIRLLKFPSNWMEAEQICNTYNGHLVSIRSDHDLDEIATEISWERPIHPFVFGAPSKAFVAEPMTVWIGLGQMCPRNQKTLPDLRWSDQTAFDKNFNFIQNRTTDIRLDTSEPLCIVQRLVHVERAPPNKIWTYANCKDDKFMFICQKPPFSTNGGFYYTPNSYYRMQPKYAGTCGPDPNWCMRNTTGLVECYKVINSANYWHDAKHICEMQESGQLVSIRTRNELEFIVNMADLSLPSRFNGYWIGLNRLNTDGSYRWSDGSPFDYIANGNLMSREDEGSCTAMMVENSPERDILWQNRHCDNRLPTVCKKTISEPRTTSSTSYPTWWFNRRGCKHGWEYHDFKCYKFMEQPVKFSDALSNCDAQNSYLVSITDAFEQAYIVAKLGSYKRDIWLGMDVNGGKMAWLDESPMQYSNFLPTSKRLIPGESKYEKGCVFMDGTEDIGYWNIVGDYTYTNTTLAYICESFPSEENLNVHLTNNPYKCIPYGGSCYYFIKYSNNALGPWMSAQELCRGLAATKSEDKDEMGNAVKYFNLLTIRDIYEWSFVASQAYQLGFNRFWIGLKENSEKLFEWADGSEIKFTRWGPGHPRNNKCVSMQIDDELGAFMYSTDCESYMPIACKASSKEAPQVPKEAGFQSANCSLLEAYGFLPGSTRCYLMRIRGRPPVTTGYDADRECFEQWGATLATFPTSDDFEVVRKI